MGKPWRCRLGWHKWIRRSTVDGQAFLQCRRCDEENPNDSPPPAAAAGF